MPWLSAVPSVLLQMMAGQEAAGALADLVFGAANPSGKLPLSFPTSVNDTWLSGPGGGPVNPAQYPGLPRDNGTWFEAAYSEGLFMGYRWYDAQVRV